MNMTQRHAIAKQKKSKQRAGMCKQMYKPQDARKSLSAIHSRGESSAEILWMKEYMEGLERDQGEQQGSSEP